MDHHEPARRQFLRAGGVALGIPLLESTAATRARSAEGTAPRRLVTICAPLGIHTPFLFPEEQGREYRPTRYLEPLQPLREQFTVISGLSHPMVDGGHAAEKSFLTGAAHPGQPSFRNSISLDQFAAERMGHHTRFPFLSLSAGYGGISYTRSGVLIPAEDKPSRLFGKLFLEGSEREKQQQVRRIRDGQSILDLVGEQTRQLQRQAAAAERQTLDQYFSSVRQLERRLEQAERWAQLPKPVVDRDPPRDIQDRADLSGRLSLLYDLMALALQTDSTRLITLKAPGGNEVVNLKGVDDGWHNLSHHGRSDEKIEQLSIIELEEMRLFAGFLGKLAEVSEAGGSLLDHTAVMLGSNLGNASSHSNTNLPIVVAGGRFQHGQHLALAGQHSPPLANLYVSFLQHLGLEVDAFSSGHATLKGLPHV
jgi:hypothetical protein